MLGARPTKPKRPLPRRKVAPAPKTSLSGLDLTQRLLYRDGLALIIDKPAGIAVHGGPRGGETLEDYFEQLRFGFRSNPHLAHRLDRDTSGCLVLGRHPKAIRRLGALFAEGRAQKTYWALVMGEAPQDSGRIEAALLKQTATKGWKMLIDPAGQQAITEWHVRGRAPGRTWIECHPLTGRTHQIRVHLAHLGLPILGDPIYGPQTGENRSQPLHLHARRIVLPLYANKPPIEAESPLPAALRPGFAACGWTA